MKLFLLVGETMLGITHLPFYFPWMTIGITTLMYGILFLVVSFISTYMIRVNEVKELLHGTSKPKPYPKTSLILVVIAIVSIGYGYYRSTITNSIDLGKDLIIVAPLIIIGTYFLFTQASVLIVKRFQQKKKASLEENTLTLGI
ncbi:ABC transporter permease protein YvcS [Bacillus sp. JCM 19045]|nr:ABC transporter permease protein YvcS [Bacillus sp. JCM 19045]